LLAHRVVWGWIRFAGDSLGPIRRAESCRCSMVERRFADQLVALAEKHNRNKDDALTIDSEYLEVIAVRHSGALPHRTGS
jgi:hypothetical protein